jgi:hypothetical protein
MQNIPMGGNVYPIGIFYISVNIGSPSQTFNAAVDSGSVLKNSNFSSRFFFFLRRSSTFSFFGACLEAVLYWSPDSAARDAPARLVRTPEYNVVNSIVVKRTLLFF